jgi:hypothetical protein
MNVSVPSRFYDLLAAALLVSKAEAMTVSENNLGWVVRPGMPDEHTRRVRFGGPVHAWTRAAAARAFTRERAMTGYCNLVEELL